MGINSRKSSKQVEIVAGKREHDKDKSMNMFDKIKTTFSGGN